MKRAALILIVLAAAACGSSSKTAETATTTTQAATTTTTTPKTDFGALYLKLIAPANKAIDRLATLNSNLDIPQNILDDINRTFQTFNDAALRIQWPAQVRPDIRDLVKADSAYLADLLAVNQQTQLSAGAYRMQIEHDGTAFTAAANAVRADLGLPPP